MEIYNILTHRSRTRPAPGEMSVSGSQMNSESEDTDGDWSALSVTSSWFNQFQPLKLLKHTDCMHLCCSNNYSFSSTLIMNSPKSSDDVEATTGQRKVFIGRVCAERDLWIDPYRQLSNTRGVCFDLFAFLW